MLLCRVKMHESQIYGELWHSKEKRKQDRKKGRKIQSNISWHMMADGYRAVKVPMRLIHLPSQCGHALPEEV